MSSSPPHSYSHSHSHSHDDDVRVRRLVIDSRDRDRSAYPLPNNYEIRLDQDLIDVLSMKLVVADIPFSAYMIDDLNCVLPVCTDGDDNKVIDVRVPIGDYDSAIDLATAVTVAVRAAVAELIAFEVTYDSRTDRYSFKANMPFEFRFASRPPESSIARVLGFAPGQNYVTPVTSHRLTAPYRKDFDTAKYVVLYIKPSAELIMSSNNATNRSFAVIARRRHAIYVEDAAFEKSWNPPVARLSKLYIQFVGYDGRPYDFQNQEHRLELVFRTRKHPRKYPI